MPASLKGVAHSLIELLPKVSHSIISGIDDLQGDGKSQYRVRTNSLTAIGQFRLRSLVADCVYLSICVCDADARFAVCSILRFSLSHAGNGLRMPSHNKHRIISAFLWHPSREALHQEIIPCKLHRTEVEPMNQSRSRNRSKLDGIRHVQCTK